MRTLILIVGLALAGCTTATDIYGPNGQKQVLLECHGALLTMGSCFKKAAEVCPKGYFLVGENGQAIPTATSIASANGGVSSSAMMTPGGYGSAVGAGSYSAQRVTVVGATVYRYLTVQCKP